MKQVFTLSLFLLPFSIFSQQKSTETNEAKPETAVSLPAKTQEIRPISRTTSSRTSEAVAVPYDVNDKYMGRSAEFLGNMTVSALPNDFPVYDKQWSLKEYNQVVDTYYRQHMNILRNEVKAKLLGPEK